MKIKHKDTGAVCFASQFNPTTVGEIIAHSELQGSTSDFIRDYDVLLSSGWMGMSKAFSEGRLIINEAFTRFWEASPPKVRAAERQRQEVGIDG